MNGRASGEPKLLFPGLAGFYAKISDLWYPMIRIVAGGCLYAHVWAKFHAGPAVSPAPWPSTASSRASFLPMPPCFSKSVGATCIIVGLFTRFFAAALAIEMALICFVVMRPQG